MLNSSVSFKLRVNLKSAASITYISLSLSFSLSLSLSLSRSLSLSLSLSISPFLSLSLSLSLFLSFSLPPSHTAHPSTVSFDFVYTFSLASFSRCKKSFAVYFLKRERIFYIEPEKSLWVTIEKI